MPYVWWKKLGGERLGDPDNTPIGRNVLTLTNIQESANYSCTAVSDLGTIVLFTEVKVQGMSLHLAFTACITANYQSNDVIVNGLICIKTRYNS